MLFRPLAKTHELFFSPCRRTNSPSSPNELSSSLRLLRLLFPFGPRRRRRLSLLCFRAEARPLTISHQTSADDELRPRSLPHSTYYVRLLLLAASSNGGDYFRLLFPAALGGEKGRELKKSETFFPFPVTWRDPKTFFPSKGTTAMGSVRI